MSTTKKVEAGSMLTVAAFVLILITIGFGRAAAPNRASGAGDAAWSSRLTQQAQYLQEKALAARAADAWAQRMTAIAKAEGKAPAPASPVISDRANKAWADRLNGLADYLSTK